MFANLNETFQLDFQNEKKTNFDTHFDVNVHLLIQNPVFIVSVFVIQYDK